MNIILKTRNIINNIYDELKDGMFDVSNVRFFLIKPEKKTWV